LKKATGLIDRIAILLPRSGCGYLANVAASAGSSVV